MNSQEKYYEYWGLTKPPFDNVPDPEMYFDMHSSVDSAVGEAMFAIEEGNECLVVIVGDVGFGKTMALRMILSSLEQEKYLIAFVTNPDMTFIQLLKEIIGQLIGKQCKENKKVKLLEIFNQLLFKTREEGKKVLIFIDEANAMKPDSLESLRLLTNMQSDEENLFTIVMAGQLELAHRLEHPKHANLFQRIGVYCRLTKIESLELMRDYIEHRLERAGTTRPIFTEAAYAAIWESSEDGVPRLVNRTAKLSLMSGQAHQMELVDETIVRQIGARFQRTPVPAPPEHSEPKRSPAPAGPEPVLLPAIPEEAVLAPIDEEEEMLALVSPAEAVPTPVDREEEVPVLAVPAEAVLTPVNGTEKMPALVAPEEAVSTPIHREEEVPVLAAPAEAVLAPVNGTEKMPALVTPEEAVPAPIDAEEAMPAAAVASPAPPMDADGCPAAPAEMEAPGEAPEEAAVAAGAQGNGQGNGQADAQPKPGKVGDLIKLPDHVYIKAGKLPKDKRLEFAGKLAAELLKKYPRLIQQLGPVNDPVPAWVALRNMVMRQMEQHQTKESVEQHQAKESVKAE